jgi:hypothetical protein
VVGLPGQNG